MSNDPLTTLAPPWRCYRDETRPDHWKVADSRGLDIADVLPWMPGPEIAARARLMAAAPELAARLRRFVAAIRDDDVCRVRCRWCDEEGCNPACDVTQAENLLALCGAEMTP